MHLIYSQFNKGSFRVPQSFKDVENSLESKKRFQSKQIELQWFLYFHHAFSQSNYKIVLSAVFLEEAV